MLEMDALANQMGNAHLNEIPDDSEPECLPFCPPEQMGISLDSIPRFLFRIATPFSDGKTNETWVHSQSALKGAPLSREDIFSNLYPQKRINVAGTLNEHLRWWPKDGPEDNFISWTSSLLFALRYIYYRYSSSRDGSSLQKIKLCVVDTTWFPRGAFVRDLDLIKAFRQFDHHHRPSRDLKDLQCMREGHCYFGEYLSQGSLRVAGKCQIVSADVFFHRDRLHHVQPLFEEIAHVPRNIYKPNWAENVLRDRKAIWTNPQPPEELRESMIAVDEIVAEFGREWKFPMAVYLAALVTQTPEPDDGEQPADDNLLFVYFRSYDSETREAYLPSTFNIDATRSMPELDRVKGLLREIDKDFQLRATLEHVMGSEASLRHILFSPHYWNRRHCPLTTDPNPTLNSAGRKLLWKLDTVKMLCEDISNSVSSAAKDDRF